MLTDTVLEQELQFSAALIVLKVSSTRKSR
jgi:hypothetical protein